MRPPLRSAAALLALAFPGLALLAAQGCMTKKSGDDHGPACAHTLPPPPPPNVAASTGSHSYDLLFVVSEFEAGIASYDDAGRPRYLDIGFDLDTTCTGEGESTSCVEPPWATGDHTDGVGGIDNAFGQIWWLKGTDPHVTNATTFALLVRVRGYSGEPSDDKVEVSLYVGRLASRDTGPAGPLWDGSDRWDILPELLETSSDAEAPGLDAPRFRDVSAYVSGGVLVARFADALWTAGWKTVPLIPVHQVVLSGSLTQGAGGWQLQNVVAGMRIGVTDALTYGAQFPDSVTGIPVCQVEADYMKLRNNLCPFVDIASVSSSPSAPCDAISSGALFQAKPAAFGAILPAGAQVAPDCAPGIHPETDRCEPLSKD